MTSINSICVHSGSSPGRLDAYASAAFSLAESLVGRHIRLVYGGASIGIMGMVADQVLKLGGQAVGVIPKALAHEEVAHNHLTELHVTQSMHERKMLMAELSDGFIALPGGIGTLEELFEIWTWAQLGFHHKPCGLLNVEGYYNKRLWRHLGAKTPHYIEPGGKYTLPRALNIWKIKAVFVKRFTS